MPAVCTAERVTEIEVRTVQHTRRCRCQVQVSGPRIGIVHDVGEEGRGDPKFQRKEVEKRTRKFSLNKNRAGACPLPTGQNLVHAMPSGRSCPTGQKRFVHARLPARSPLILKERAAAAAVLRQQTYCCCCCSGLQNRTRFSDEKDLGRNRQT
jgi:hypothetical protein